MSFWEQQRVVVTGGKGFLGTHVVAALKVDAMIHNAEGTYHAAIGLAERAVQRVDRAVALVDHLALEADVGEG